MDKPPSKESDDSAPRLLSPFAFTLPLLGSLFVLPLLDWQRALLKAYQKALADPAWLERWEEDAKSRAGLLMEAYLESSKSRQEFGEQWVAWQSDLVRGYLETLDGVLRSFERRTSR